MRCDGGKADLSCRRLGETTTPNFYAREAFLPYVFYDVETTGLRKRFDQIVQFAAVLTDETLQIQERFEVRARLQPHIIPAPGALVTTGTRIEELLSASRQSYYNLVKQVHERLDAWPSSLFVGFNSISFDEEVLRHALYQNLFPAYATTTGGSARADALSLARLAAHLRPDVLAPHREQGGRAIFRLSDLAAANGIQTPRRHDAMGDVETTLALCTRIKEGAPDLWSRWVRFAQKSAVSEFVRDEDAFVFFEAWSNTPEARVVTRIAGHSEQQHVHHCLDLGLDIGQLNALSETELVNACASRASPIVTLRANAAPLICALYEASPDQTGGMTEDEALRRVEWIRSEPILLDRLRRAAIASEPRWPASPNVEEQLYGFPFPQGPDPGLLARFHAASWDERAALCSQFSDSRFKQLSRRIIYFERPELLPPATKEAMDAEVRRRARMTGGSPPWLTISAAYAEVAELQKRGLSEEEREIVDSYTSFLHSLSAEFARVDPV